MSRLVQAAILLLATSMSVVASSEVLPPTPGLERFRFARLSVDNGLSQATARSIVQDHHGRVWIGTQEGLNRIDAEGIHVYRHEPANPRQSLPDNHIIALQIDAAGRLWVATQVGPPVWLDVDTDRFHRLTDPSDSSQMQPATALRAKADGSMWVALVNGDLLHVDGSTLEFQRLRHPALADVVPIRAMLSEGRALLIAAAGGVWQHPDPLSLADQEWRALLRDDTSALLRDRDGRLWLGLTRGGLAVRDEDKAWQHIRHQVDDSLSLSDNAVRGLLQDRYGRLWVGTQGGLSVGNLADPMAPRFTRLQHRPEDVRSLPATRTGALLEDAEGMIWVGTWTGGVGIHDPDAEAVMNVVPQRSFESRVPAMPAVTVLEDDDGRVWAGLLEQGGLVRYAWGRGVDTEYLHRGDDPHSLGGGFVQLVLRDSHGNLWAASFGAGLRRLREDESGFDAFVHDPEDPSSIISNMLHAMTEDSHGNLWVGTTDAGVSMLCAGCSHFEHLASDGFIPGDATTRFVNTIYEDGHGDLWFGLRGGGLWRLQVSTGELSGYRAAAGVPGALSHDAVTSVHHSGDELWVGTQGGGLNILSLSAPDRGFRWLKSSDGLSADAIGGILEDAQGRLWVSTTRGISVIEQGRVVRNLGTMQGAQSSGYFIGAAHRGASGRLYFGGLGGLTVIDPQRLAEPRPPPAVLISDLLLMNTSLRVDQSLHGVRLSRAPVSVELLSLPYDRHLLGIEFAAASFASPGQLRYRYRLQGLDSDWVLTTSGRAFASYSSLASGRYLFQVQAARQGGEWGDVRELTLHVATSPWLRPPALLGYAAALLLLAGIAALRILSVRRERARANLALQLSRERLKLALWGSGDELWDVDSVAGVLHRENHLDLLNSETQGDTALETFWKNIHPDDLQGINDAFRAHVNGERVDFRAAYRARDRSGGWRWLFSRGRVSKHDEAGRPIRVSGTTRDITELKEAEEALRQLNEQLEHRVEERTGELTRANEQLRSTLQTLHETQHHLIESEKLAALGGLVAGVAHEINTPLGIAVTAASHLDSETRQLNQERQEGRLSRSRVEAYLDAAAQGSQLVLRNLNRADQLVRSFKQVAVDQSSERRRELDMQAYLDEIQVSLRPLLRASAHRLEVDCGQDISMDSYPGAIYQVVVNLVVNALTHAFEDGQQGLLRLSVQASGERVLLCFEDDGRGVNEEQIKRLFEPFFTTRMGQGGSGLGLHIVYNLVTGVLGGRIQAESRPGEGLRYLIDLPRDAP